MGQKLYIFNRDSSPIAPECIITEKRISFENNLVKSVKFRLYHRHLNHMRHLQCEQMSRSSYTAIKSPKVFP